MKTLHETGRQLALRLQAIDFDRLPISDYNKQYIGRLKPVLGYYMRIFAECLQQGIKLSGSAPAAITCVDYGGGSGFFSLFAKEAGIGQVIYVDLNPLSVRTVSAIKAETGIGPDVILEGDSDVLSDWCRTQQIEPQLLIATDLIEHVYDLSRFFADLMHISPDMHLIFTTASTPYNPIVKRRLHRIMDECEKGDRVLLNYFTARQQYIRTQYPHLTEQQVTAWSRQTRGLTYTDIKQAIDNNHPPILRDAHNTCDPASGNWTERILPIHTYRSLAAPHQYRLRLSKGFYNTERSTRASSFLCRCVNGLIRLTGNAGYLLAPFIILTFLGSIRKIVEDKKK